MAKYKTILLKLSGEALSGNGDKGIYDPKIIDELVDTIKKIKAMGVNLGIVIGGGNIFRGRISKKEDMDPAKADYMGIMATLINAVALNEIFNHHGIPSVVISALEVENVARKGSQEDIDAALKENKVIVFGAGTGKPFCTTDTCSALRAVDIKADCILMAKRGVEGVYTSDPNVDKNAKFISKLTYQEAIDQHLKVIDESAFKICNDNKMNIQVFNGDKLENIIKILNGESLGTLVSK